MQANRLAPRAEGFGAYRWAQLLIIASVYEGSERKRPLTLDRLAIYEFFSAHPFLIFDTATSIGRALVRAGLEPRSLTYASAPDRLANRRQRVQADVTDLVARNLINVVVRDGRLALELSDEGESTAERLGSLHAQAVRESAKEVIAKLDRLADRTLRSRATTWTQHNALMIDILEAT